MLLMIVTVKPKVNVPFLQKMKILRSTLTKTKIVPAIIFFIGKVQGPKRFKKKIWDFFQKY